MRKNEHVQRLRSQVPLQALVNPKPYSMLHMMRKMRQNMLSLEIARPVVESDITYTGLLVNCVQPGGVGASAAAAGAATGHAAFRAGAHPSGLARCAPSPPCCTPWPDGSALGSGPSSAGLYPPLLRLLQPQSAGTSAYNMNR